MGFIALAVLTAAFIIHCAYTIRFQRAIIATGKRISDSSGDYVSDELIYILTPRSQIIRNIINYILISAIFVLGTVVCSWCLAVVILVVSLCLLSPLVAALFPKPDDPRYLKSIRKGLFELIQNSGSNGYASIERQLYLEEIMSKLRDLEPENQYTAGRAG